MIAKPGKGKCVNYSKNDVFSCGMVAHNMMTGGGVDPFAETSTAKFTEANYNQPPACYLDELRAIVWRMLHPTIAARFSLGTAEAELAAFIGRHQFQPVLVNVDHQRGYLTRGAKSISTTSCSLSIEVDLAETVAAFKAKITRVVAGTSFDDVILAAVATATDDVGGDGGGGDGRTSTVCTYLNTDSTLVPSPISGCRSNTEQPMMLVAMVAVVMVERVRCVPI
jgi:hypothetical protein